VQIQDTSDNVAVLPPEPPIDTLVAKAPRATRSKTKSAAQLGKQAEALDLTVVNAPAGPSMPSKRRAVTRKKY